MESISVIIPTLNEAENIKSLIPYLKSEIKNFDHEIIIVDSSASDECLAIVSEIRDVTLIKSKIANRAVQMNLGAQKASKHVLFFLHADCLPPQNFHKSIQNNLNGSNLGCFYAHYKSSKFIFKLNSQLTKLPFEFCRGGDQGIFILKKTFNQLHGFDESFAIMEEYEFFRRAKKANLDFCIIKKPMTVSLRKYKNRSWFKVNKANLIAMYLFKCNASSLEIKARYSALLN